MSFLFGLAACSRELIIIKNYNIHAYIKQQVVTSGANKGDRQMIRTVGLSTIYVIRHY